MYKNKFVLIPISYEPFLVYLKFRYKKLYKNIVHCALIIYFSNFNFAL